MRSLREMLLGLSGLIASVGAKGQAAKSAPPHSTTSTAEAGGVPDVPKKKPAIIQIESPPLMLPVSRYAKPDPQRDAWVHRSLTEMQTVRPGMTRADLDHFFERAGGYYAVFTGEIYSFRACPYFQVEVAFCPALSPNRNSHGDMVTPQDPKDIITKISKPYVEEVSYD